MKTRYDKTEWTSKVSFISEELRYYKSKLNLLSSKELNKQHAHAIAVLSKEIDLAMLLLREKGNYGVMHKQYECAVRQYTSLKKQYVELSNKVKSFLPDRGQAADM